MNRKFKIISQIVLTLLGICTIVILIVQTDNRLTSLRSDSKHQEERILKLENTVARLISGEANKTDRVKFTTIEPTKLPIMR